MGWCVIKAEHLFYAVEICDTGSFSKAAANLYVSQPNLSYAIKQLEQSLGFPIFERTKVGVVLTEPGRRIIEQFRTIRHEYNYIQQLLDQPKRNAHLFLRVATLNCSRIVPAFTQFAKHYSGSPVDFSFTSFQTLNDLLPKVETCQLDFAIITTLSPFIKSTVLSISNRSIEYYTFSDAPLCAIVGRENPLFNTDAPMHLEQLYPYVIVRHGGEAQDPVQSISHVAGLTHHCLGEIHVDTERQLYDIIRSTSAVALAATTPEVFMRYNSDPDVKALPVEDCDIYAQFAWIKSRRLPLSDLALELLETVRPYFI